MPTFHSMVQIRVSEKKILPERYVPLFIGLSHLKCRPTNTVACLAIQRAHIPLTTDQLFLQSLLLTLKKIISVTGDGGPSSFYDFVLKKII